MRVAVEPAVARRAVLYAVVVGTLLIVINYGDAIVRGDTGTSQLLRMALTVLVPYAVATASSVGAIGEARRAGSVPQREA